MSERRTSRQFVKDRAAFKAKCAADDAACWLCTQHHIDYLAPHDDWSNGDRFQLDHFYPVSTHPELQHDPANFRPSAASCNDERGNRNPRPSLGVPSRKWT